MTDVTSQAGVPQGEPSRLSGRLWVAVRRFDDELAGSVLNRAFAVLAPGDVVSFDASSDDGSDIDHTGIYLGVDQAGHARFVSSRKSADGPTMGDLRGRSTLDGTGYYATAFRTARRI